MSWLQTSKQLKGFEVWKMVHNALMDAQVKTLCNCKVHYYSWGSNESICESMSLSYQSLIFFFKFAIDGLTFALSLCLVILNVAFY